MLAAVSSCSWLQRGEPVVTQVTTLSTGFVARGGPSVAPFELIVCAFGNSFPGKRDRDREGWRERVSGTKGMPFGKKPKAAASDRGPQSLDQLLARVPSPRAQRLGESSGDDMVVSLPVRARPRG